MARFVENCFALDVDELRREGYLATGVRTRRITIEGFGGEQQLEFCFDMVGSSGSITIKRDRARIQTLDLVRPTDTLGRTRWFFEMDGETFQKAYYHAGVFASRKAHGLLYVQQAESTLERSLRLMRRLQAQEALVVGDAAQGGDDSDDEAWQDEQPLSPSELLFNQLAQQLVLQGERPTLSARRRRANFAALVQNSKDMHGRKPRTHPVLNEPQIEALLQKVPPIKAPKLLYRSRGDNRRNVSSTAYLHINVMRRLGWFIEGERVVTCLGWDRPWDTHPQRDIDLVVDLRDPEKAQAALVLQEAGSTQVEAFPIVRLPGDFGRTEPRFVCPTTGQASRFLLFNGVHFSVPATHRQA